MLAKIFLAVFLMTSVMSLAKDEHESEVVNSVLVATTNVMKEVSKLASDDERFFLDLTALYKKYEIASKADQVKDYVQSKLKTGFEYTNDIIKRADIQSEEHLKKSIDLIKKEDTVLGEKLTKFYDKSCDLDRISEDIIKYVLDADKINNSYDKVRSALRPMEHKLADSVKKLEAFVLEHLPKKGKK